ncbi:hypothetical protein EV682_1144 [Iodobacter fluviatilis]|uniref:Immunity protein 43 domain-containing protein n=2 Tax=Iodobacter fluviatilis TaxID=537 RepID=A0A377Q4Y9_9NEIS|nr:hypothetical protein EV682_1144 [Iodobacter fluviatilis]STQ89882.1 Uncharacterised protein [Iodobacter fluviatilis]
MSKYFVMAAKEETGCPSGFYYVYLLNTFDAKTYKTGGYGKLPWYTGPKRYGTPIPPFPSDLFLVTENTKYEYDIRSGSSYFYVLSEKFASIISEYKTNFIQISPVKYIDKNGDGVLGKSYFVGRTKPLKKEEVFDLHASKFVNESNYDFELLKIKNEFNFDLFDTRYTAPIQFSLIISEKMKAHLEREGIKGVDFLDLDLLKLNKDQSTSNEKPTYDPI